MLSPDERTLLVDLLAPPEPGFRLERAVTTTFTLHLTALLPIPLALAGADLTSSPDPLSVLQAVRSYADRIDVFCQAGNVAVPAQRSDLLAFLEPMVHQVAAPSSGHLFHPKIWVLRFVGPDDDERYRLVVGSRNLTHDRAWDTVLSLDGRRTLQPKSVNRVLAEFLTSLPERVPGGVPVERRDALAELAEGLRYVEWERPEDVVDEAGWLTFHIFGRGRRPNPDLTGGRRLIISPFLNAKGLEASWPDGDDCTIISRQEELDALDDDARAWFDGASRTFVLNETAAIPDEESDDAGLRWALSGLHAKYYVVERNRRAHVFIGSANATDAAWGGNDEILIELVGRPRVYGVAATLGEENGKDKGGLAQILLPHTFGDLVVESPEDELIRSLENALRELAALTYTVTVEGDHEAPVLWARTDEPVRRADAIPKDASLSAELLTMPGQIHRPSFGSRLDHRWALTAVEDITPFLVLRLSTGAGSSAIEVSTVVLARLVGDLDDRLDRVLARHIGTPAEFLRFVLLLLQLAGREDIDPGLLGTGGAFGAFTTLDDSAGLLEAVVRALADHPAAIDDIDRLVNQLSKTEKGRSLLPDQWTAFWAQVMAARARIGSEA